MQEHLQYKQGAYMCFADLLKAYDLIPRECLLQAFAQELRVPDHMVAALWWLYTGLSAQIMVDGKLSDFFDMDEGVRQGCPTLTMVFSLYMDHIEWFYCCKPVTSTRIGAY